MGLPTGPLLPVRNFFFLVFHLIDHLLPVAKFPFAPWNCLSPQTEAAANHKIFSFHAQRSSEPKRYKIFSRVQQIEAAANHCPTTEEAANRTGIPQTANQPTYRINAQQQKQQRTTQASRRTACHRFWPILLVPLILTSSRRFTIPGQRSDFRLNWSDQSVRFDFQHIDFSSILQY